MGNTQSNQATAREKAVMYRPTKHVLYRDSTRIINQEFEDGFFTSKAKAVDQLRVYSEKMFLAEVEYERYAEGLRFGWVDVFVALWVYEESEGRLIRTASIPYKEVMDGQYLDRSGDARFETF